MPVTRLALRDHLTGGYVKSGKQGSGAVSDVVVGDSLHVSQTHRQQWLGSIESLHLGLLVDAEYHCLLRGVQVEADDVPDLLDKEGICRDFECPLAMGLEAECLEPAMDRAFRDSGFSGEGAGAPLGAAVAGFRLQCTINDFGYLVVLISAGTAGTQLVMQSLNAIFPVALSPFPYGHSRDAHSLGNRGVCFTGATGQNYFGSLHKSVWQ